LITTIVRLVLILYGTWTLYCLYQFKNGDSWGVHVLAGITLALFTAILGFFAWRIVTVARHAKKDGRFPGAFVLPQTLHAQVWSLL